MIEHPFSITATQVFSVILETIALLIFVASLFGGTDLIIMSYDRPRPLPDTIYYYISYFLLTNGYAVIAEGIVASTILTLFAELCKNIDRLSRK